MKELDSILESFLNSEQGRERVAQHAEAFDAYADLDTCTIYDELLNNNNNNNKNNNNDSNSDTTQTVFNLVRNHLQETKTNEH